jgi:hypothetical protein
MLLKELAKRADIAERPLYQVEERPGYGLTQAFTSGSDVAFAATSAAAKAAIALARESDALARESPTLARLLGVLPPAQVLFPVVVIDARLFECYLRGGSSPTIAEIERGTLTWRNPIVGMPHTILHVVTRTGLPGFLDGARDSIDYTLGSCEREAASVVVQWRESKAETSVSFGSWEM